MTFRTKARSTSGIRVIGAESAGVATNVAESVSMRVEGAYRHTGHLVRTVAIRFIPSTKTELGNGSFEVLASATIKSLFGRRLEAADTVLTIGLVDGRQYLQAVTVPILNGKARISKPNAEVLHRYQAKKPIKRPQRGKALGSAVRAASWTA